ncbi:MAG: tetratricopeptide repeat protein [Candidatus Omnitrophota bacterium]|jgi:tetratricopeptide (TPR) repeat protein
MNFMEHIKYPSVVIVAAILGVTALAFSPVLNNGFVFWDDNSHVVENRFIRSLSPERILAIFQSTVCNTYIPLSALSLALEYRVFGLDPFIYHLNNLILHLGVTGLIFVFIRRCGYSFFVSSLAALLFGVHPMHVESVAWISERKDVLYAFFYMLALVSYQRHVRRTTRIGLVLSFLLGFLSLLAKPMAASLPFIMLLYDWFARRPMTKSVIVEKIILALLMGPIVWITFSLNRHPFTLLSSETVLTWSWCFIFYLRAFLFPVQFFPYYVFPQSVSWSNWHFVFPFFCLILLAGAAWVFRARRVFIFAALYYWASVFLVLRFDHRYFVNIVADRFMYLPSLGACLFFAAAAEQLFFNARIGPRGRGLVAGGLTALFLLLSFKTYTQSQTWHDDDRLWEETLRRYPDIFYPYYARASANAQKGLWGQALKDYNKVLGLNPRFASGYNDRGLVYLRQGRSAQAFDDFNQAIALRPGRAVYYLNRGYLYEALERPADALRDYDQALRLDPQEVRAHVRRAEIYRAQGRAEDAVLESRRAREKDPLFLKLHGVE